MITYINYTPKPKKKLAYMRHIPKVIATCLVLPWNPTRKFIIKKRFIFN